MLRRSRYISRLSMPGFRAYQDTVTGSYLFRFDVPVNFKDRELESICLTITPVPDQGKTLVKLAVLPIIEEVWKEKGLDKYNAKLFKVLDPDDDVITEKFKEGHPFYSAELEGCSSVVVHGEDVHTFPADMLPCLQKSYSIPPRITDFCQEIIHLAQLGKLNKPGAEMFSKLEYEAYDISALHPAIHIDTGYKM